MKDEKDKEFEKKMKEKYGLKSAEEISLQERLESAYKKMKKEQRRLQANVHFDKGEYAEALFYCDKLIAGGLKDASLWSLRGNVMTTLGNYDEAVVAYGEAIKLTPKDAGRWFTLAQAKVKLGRNEEAIQDLNEALKLNSKKGSLWGARGKLKCNLGRYEEAIQDLNEALKLDSKSALAWEQRGAAKRMLGRYEEAIQDLNEALKLKPKSAFAWQERGEAKRQLGRYEEAIQDLNEALKLKPKSAFAWCSRGAAKRQLGRYEEAIQDLNEALKLDPKSAFAWEHRGTAKRWLNRNEEAIQDLNEALKLDPKIAFAWCERGLAKYYLGRYEEAIQDLSEALKLNSKNFIAWRWRGEAKAKLNRYEEAIQDLNEAIKLDPKNNLAWQERGSAKRMLGRNEEAIQDLNEALKLDPKSAFAWQTRGAAKRMLGRCEEAIQDVNEALKLDPKSDFAWCERGLAKYDLGRYEEAIQDLSEALKLNSKNFMAWRWRGEAKAKLNRYEEAIRDLSKALELEPGNVDIESQIVELRKWDQEVKEKAKAALDELHELQAKEDYEAQRYAEAISCCDKVLAVQPDNLKILQIRGESHAKLNHHREAIQDFNKIILLDPINETALVYLGVARQSLGQNKEAVDDLTKAIVLNALLDYAWMFRGVAQQALGCFEESFEDLSEAVRLNPESNFAHKKLKEVKGVLINGWKNKATQYYKTKQYTETIFYCDKVILENPEEVGMLQLRGDSKLKRGNYEEAIQDLMEVLKVNPDNTYVKECLKEARRNLKDESQASTSALPPKLSATSQDSPVFSHTIKFSMAIPKDQLVFEEKLGEGSFGEVHKGIWSPTSLYQVPVAIKRLKNATLSVKSLEEFRKEVEIQAKLNSVGVVKLLGITAEQPYCMVMEFMEQGSLRDVLDRQKPEEILWSVRIQMAITMAEGLSYLHDQNPIIIHGDLKSLNILVNGKGEAKLADFGLAALKTETRSKEYVEGNAEKNKGPKGSLLWIAPELFRMNAKRTPATDVFSFAVVLWELASHLFPYESAYGDSHRIQDWVEKGERESFDERTPNTPKEYSDLTQRCWDGKPENRPSAKSIVVELEALYASTPLAPTLFSSGAQPSSPKVPVKKPANINSGGHLVKSVNPLTKSKTGSPKVPPRKSLVGSGNYLVKSTTSSSTSSPTSSPQVPPKSPYLGNVYK